MIEGCLAHIAGLADEIIVVDGESSDGTVAAGAAIPDRVITTSNKAMLEINKNIAMRQRRAVRILVLDPTSGSHRPFARRFGRSSSETNASIRGTGCRGATTLLGRWVRTMGMYPGSQLATCGRGGTVQREATITCR